MIPRRCPAALPCYPRTRLVLRLVVIVVLLVVTMVGHRRRRRWVIVVMIIRLRSGLGGGLHRLDDGGVAAGEEKYGCGEQKGCERCGSSHRSFSSCDRLCLLSVSEMQIVEAQAAGGRFLVHILNGLRKGHVIDLRVPKVS
jgi:hypothetical protein